MPREDAGLCNYRFFSDSRGKQASLAVKKKSVILSRTVEIREDQFKLNSKLALPNYLQLKV